MEKKEINYINLFNEKAEQPNMTLQESTFKTLEVHQFLVSNHYLYSSKCFYADTLGQDTVTADFLQKWFKRQFVAGLSSRLYRRLEATVTQHMEIA